MKGFVFGEPDIQSSGPVTPVPFVYWFNETITMKDVERGARRFVRVTTKRVTKNRTLRAIVKEIYGN